MFGWRSVTAHCAEQEQMLLVTTNYQLHLFLINLNGEGYSARIEYQFSVACKLLLTICLIFLLIQL
jgi:hypothetical protein